MADSNFKTAEELGVQELVTKVEANIDEVVNSLEHPVDRYALSGTIAQLTFAKAFEYFLLNHFMLDGVVPNRNFEQRLSEFTKIAQSRTKDMIKKYKKQILSNMTDLQAKMKKDGLLNDIKDDL